MILDGPARDKRLLHDLFADAIYCYTTPTHLQERCFIAIRAGDAYTDDRHTCGCNIVSTQRVSRASANGSPVQAIILVGDANPVRLAVQHVRQCSLRQLRAIILVTEMGSDQVLQPGAVQPG